VPSAFSAPALPVSNDKHQVPLLEELTIQEDADVFYLGCLSEQGSYTLILPELPSHLDISALTSRLRDLPGCVSGRLIEPEGSAEKVDLILHFATAVEAAMALATQPPINIGDGVQRHIRYADEHVDSGERPSKRVKVVEPPVPLPQCKICSEEMDGTYSRPCFYCRSTWCYECLHNQFTASLDDQERFPAKCCGRVLHFDVARTVVPENDYAKYRTRFEQHNTTKPIYCASPRCSAFLPSRTAKPNEKGQVLCAECTSITCTECRVVVPPTEVQAHKCVAADETAALLKQFDYKRCPRCNTGVAKMYGCSHVRCQCSAHWCWDCQRPIQICWSRPCERAREDGDETDDYDIPQEESESEEESEQNTVTADTHPPAPDAITPAVLRDTILLQPTIEVAAIVPEPQQAEAVSPTYAPTAEVAQPRPTDHNVHIEQVVNGLARETQQGTAAQALPGGQEVPPGRSANPSTTAIAAPTLQEPFLNLDGEDANDWEAGGFDFGDEPIDETWDTWGCLHHFNPVLGKAVWQDRKEWLPDTRPVATTNATVAKQIDCLKCYKTVVLTQPLQEDPGKQRDKQVDVDCTDLAGDSNDTPTMGDDAGVATDRAVGPEQPCRRGKKKRRNKKQGDVPSLFNCPKCGVFYCAECKKAATKEINGLLEKREIRI